jgi:hypothetical protein
MPQPNDLFLVIRSFIDRNGNSYQLRNIPYTYHELPETIRDNINFCVPFEQNKIETIILTEEKDVVLSKFNEEKQPVVHKAKLIKTTTIKKDETTVEE